jgi:hypothetical protein
MALADTWDGVTEVWFGENLEAARVSTRGVGGGG